MLVESPGSTNRNFFCFVDFCDFADTSPAKSPGELTLPIQSDPF